MQRASRTILLGLVLISAAACLEPAPTTTVAGLQLAPDGGIEGTLRVGGERLVITARVDRGHVLATVLGEDGAYAEIDRDLAEGVPMIGTLGGRAFGSTADTADTAGTAAELDPAPWRALARSHTGDVLRAVAEAAAPLAGAGDAAETLAQLPRLLDALALQDSAEAAPDIDTDDGTDTVAGVGCKTKGLRVAVTGGTAYLAITLCGARRGPSVVNECTGHTVRWRVRNYTTGTTVNSGTAASCQGRGAGEFYTKIRLEAFNRYGYWDGWFW